MNIFFDVDYTLISSSGLLRPGVRECFQRLVDDGHIIHIWSGVGLRQYEVRHHQLESYIAGVYIKPLTNYREDWQRQGVPVDPDFVIDDHLDVVRAFGGIFIRPYYYPDDTDQEMEGIYQAIRSYAETGSTLHPHFWPGNGKR